MAYCWPDCLDRKPQHLLFSVTRRKREGQVPCVCDCLAALSFFLPTRLAAFGNRAAWPREGDREAKPRLASPNPSPTTSLTPGCPWLTRCQLSTPQGGTQLNTCQIHIFICVEHVFIRENVVDKCANNMPHPNPSKVGLGAPPKFGPLAFNPKVFFQLCTRNCFCPGYLMSLQFKHPHPTPNYSLFGWAHSNCPNITLGDAFGIDILFVSAPQCCPPGTLQVVLVQGIVPSQKGAQVWSSQLISPFSELISPFCFHIHDWQRVKTAKVRIVVQISEGFCWGH